MAGPSSAPSGSGESPGLSLERLVRLHSRRSVALCGRSARQFATVAFFEDRERVFGVQRCGSPWSCPSCASRVRGRRCGGIVAIASDVASRGGSLAMATLTVRHHSGMRLSDLLEAVSAGWGAVLRDRAVVAFRRRAGVLGFIRGLEVTYGPSGWHPHLHVLWFFSGPVSSSDLLELRGLLEAGWFRGVFNVLGVAPLSGVAIDVREMSSDAAGYVAKVGFEVSGVGKGLGPFGLLLEGRVDLWREYDDAMRGVRSLVISPRLGRDYSYEWGGSEREIVDDDVLEVPPLFTVSVNPQVWFDITGSDECYREFVAAARAGETVLYEWYFSRVLSGSLRGVEHPFFYYEVR